MTLRIKDGENVRYFVVSSVEARSKKYSFDALGKTCHYHQVSILVNNECLWVESCEIGDIQTRSQIIALQDSILDALVSRIEDTCILNWHDILRAAKEENE